MTSATTFGDALERTMASGVPAAVAKSMSTETPELLAPSKSVLGFIALQPDSATAGDSYVVTTGVNTNNIAIRGADGIWHFTTPYEGYIVYDQQTAKFYEFVGAAWSVFTLTADLSNVTGILPIANGGSGIGVSRVVTFSTGSKTITAADSKIFIDASGGLFTITYPKALTNTVDFYLDGVGITPVTIQDDVTPTPNSFQLVNAGQAFARVVGDGTRMHAGYTQ